MSFHFPPSKVARESGVTNSRASTWLLVLDHVSADHGPVLGPGRRMDRDALAAIGRVAVPRAVRHSDGIFQIVHCCILSCHSLSASNFIWRITAADLDSRVRRRCLTVNLLDPQGNGRPAEDEIRQASDPVLASTRFQKSARMRGFLPYVVEKPLAGEADQTKEILIAEYVFERRNLAIDDTIVRSGAVQLRNYLQEYYGSQDGRRDPIRS